VLQGLTSLVRNSSIAWTILAVIMLTSLVISGGTLVIMTASFWNGLERAQLAQLQDYITERGQLDAALFQRMETTQSRAIDALERRMDTLDDATVEEQFDRLFPLQPDGTRRSRDDLFEGYAGPEGDVHYGVGAYLNPQQGWDMERKRRLVAAYHVVDRFGEALHGLLDNIYFFSDDNELVISAASRPDRLVFYRREAPASFDLRDSSFFPLVLPENNPDGELVCDELSQLLYVTEGEALTTGCFTPYRDTSGHHLGAFGTTVELRNYFTEALANPPPNGENLIIDQQGNLIAHADLLQSRVTPEAVERLSGRLQTANFLQAIQRSGIPGGTGLVTSDSGRWIIGYAHLEGPDWYALALIDRAAFRRELAGQVFLVAVIGMLGIALQAGLAYVILNRRVARPLRLLTRHFGAARPASAYASEPLAGILRTGNELGRLARRLEGQRARNEQILEQLEERVAERTRELETANRYKSEFLAMMSHEIRTPLNGILGLADVIRMNAADPEQGRRARMIHDSGEMLTALLNDILDLSKIEAGKLELAPQPADLRLLLSNVEALFEDSAEGKGLTLDCSADASVPVSVEIDTLRVNQCVANLVSNAIKFTREGGVRVEASARPADTDAELDVVITVTDTGPGIEPETLDKLFAPFTQASAGTAGAHGGTGLGLAISRQLADLMGGGLTARSTPGTGSEFTLTFRTRSAAPPAPSEAALTIHDLARAPEYDSIRGRRVLLVEDNYINRQVASAFLAPLDAQVVEAVSGEDALGMLQDEAVDIVLMDVRMPGIDGLETTRRIRAIDGPAADLPVVALTANASDADRQVCTAAGMDAHASKPLTPKMLYDAMALAMQARPRA